MPTRRRPILSQLLVTTATALAVVALYLYFTRPSVPVIHQSPLHDHLARNISVSFDNLSLTEAIAAIATEVQLPIDVDWPTLATMGITPEQPVTLRLKDVPAHAALSALLAQMPNGEPIVWGERNRRIAIGDATTVKAPVVRAYELAELAREYATFTHSSSVSDDVDQGFGGRGTFSPVPTPPTITDVNARCIDELASILLSTVDPDTWVDNGGSTGRMEYKMNRLVIAQTPENHEKIQRILLALRLRDTTGIDEQPDRSTP